MASITDTDPLPVAESGGFRPSMLLNDSRYRSVTLQVITLVLVVAGFVWLGWNAKENLEALGKDFRFDFLSQPASYDINQTLIDYTSRSPHWKAAVAGILNTFVVAILGIVTATIMGVLAGVARLSNNWIIARLMTVYVEVFRNVPLLIWILVAIALLTDVFPGPRNPWLLPGEIGAITKRGVYLPALTFGEGSLWVVAAFVLGIVAAFLFRRWARERQMRTGQILPVVPIMLALVIIPPLVVEFIGQSTIGVSYPEANRFGNFSGGFEMSGALFALWMGLSLYTGAFIAEVVRGGIQAVSKGQREAAAALGLRPGRVMNLVVLPQALRIIIPPLISQYLNLIKNSSLAIATGYMDVTGTLGGITLNQTGREMECIILLMSFYLTVSILVSAVMNAYNKRIALTER